jgi:hypothetical protein
VQGARRPLSRVGDAAAETFRWAGANIAPLVLLPLAAVLVWVAIWKVWLPDADTPAATTKTVTTVTRNPAVRPTHSVTTVVKATAGAPSPRRSETLVIALLFIGSGAAVVGVFHRRLASVELGADGLKVTLTKAEQDGLAQLVGTLQRGGADADRLALGVRRYVDAVAAHRQLERPRRIRGSARAVEEARGGLSADQAGALAQAIAAEQLAS